MHDTNSHRAAFRSIFNGDNRSTIRFIFEIERYAAIADFQDAQSLFISIYNALPEYIQTRFGKDKTEVIRTQRAALTDESTAEEKTQADIYSTDKMQEFFITNFRPTVSRGNLFRHLKSIRMRYNENPRMVVARVDTAIKYAKRTIALLNKDAQSTNIQEIHDADVAEVLRFVFCVRNNRSDESNNGGINKLMQQSVRRKKLGHDLQTW